MDQVDDDNVMETAYNYYEKGNLAYKIGQFEKAFFYYSNGIEIYGEDHELLIKCLLNSSQCSLLLRDFEV